MARGTRRVRGSCSGPQHCPEGQGQPRTRCTELSSLWPQSSQGTQTGGGSSRSQRAGSAGAAREKLLGQGRTAEPLQTRCAEGELPARQLASFSQLWPFPKLRLSRERRAHPAARPCWTPLQSGASLG